MNDTIYKGIFLVFFIFVAVCISSLSGRGLDGTGPNGQGPRTGRGIGNCNQSQGQFQGQCFGKGQGFARGRGMGQGRNMKQERCRFVNTYNDKFVK